MKQKELKMKCNQCNSKKDLKEYQFSTDSIHFKLDVTLCKKCSKNTYSVNCNRICSIDKKLKQIN